MREIKFRAWSNKHQHMFRVNELSQNRDGYTHGTVDEEYEKEFEPEFNSPFVWIGRVDFTKAQDGHVAGLFQNPDDEPFHLMQFTGLKDKTGAEIYEGDIFFEWEDGVYRWIVQWNAELGRWELREPDIAEIFYEEDMLATIENGELKGNIYEHPHLLEVPNE